MVGGGQEKVDRGKEGQETSEGEGVGGEGSQGEPGEEFKKPGLDKVMSHGARETIEPPKEPRINRTFA